MDTFARTPEMKVLRDCVHGYIHIDLQVIWDLLNTREFQRLRRIHQLGGDFQVYHTAEHSRFSHSLGVYEIVRRMTEEVEDIRMQLDQTSRTAVLCAALLHDLGHGPFSHFFETLSHIHHEAMTLLLIESPETEVHQVLEGAMPGLAAFVSDILRKEPSCSLLSQMVSSQLDADRMDYLLRDAYETGTSYGKFDLERILRTLRVREGKLCVKESGMHSVEDYIMARYHMYYQVYLHPDAQAYELLIDRFFQVYARIRSVEPIGLLEPFFTGMSVDEFLDMDEARMLTAFQMARKSTFPVLRDLACRILDRHLFEWLENPEPQQEEQILKLLDQAGMDPAVYFCRTSMPAAMYLPYVESASPVWIVDHHDVLTKLSCHSEIVKALEKMEVKNKKRIYFPKELAPF